MRLFASNKDLGVANVECAVGAAKEVNPRHSDDDAIVDWIGTRPIEVGRFCGGPSTRP